MFAVIRVYDTLFTWLSVFFLTTTRPPPERPPRGFCSLVWFMAFVFNPDTICSLHACCLCLCRVLGLLQSACLCAVLCVLFLRAEITWRGSRACTGELTQGQCCCLPLVTWLFIQLRVMALLRIIWSICCRALGYTAAMRSSQAEVERQFFPLWFFCF